MSSVWYPKIELDGGMLVSWCLPCHSPLWSSTRMPWKIYGRSLDTIMLGQSVWSFFESFSSLPDVSSCVLAPHSTKQRQDREKMSRPVYALGLIRTPPQPHPGPGTDTQFMSDEGHSVSFLDRWGSRQNRRGIRREKTATTGIEQGRHLCDLGEKERDKTREKQKKEIQERRKGERERFRRREHGRPNLTKQANTFVEHLGSGVRYQSRVAPSICILHQSKEKDGARQTTQLEQRETTA